jgi:hypothetical protein
LFFRNDVNTGKSTKGLDFNPPLTPGRWNVHCEVIAPFPDPKDEKSMVVSSNVITVDVVEKK